MGDGVTDYHFEGKKLFYDAVKHLTTICTGSIIIFAGILGRTTGIPEAAGYAAAAMLSLILSIVCCVIVMAALSMKVHRAGSDTDEPDLDKAVHGGMALFLPALGLFVLGMAFLAVFTIKNLW
jgi:hypothetical protein